MTIALNAPDVTCPYCRGEGAYARTVKVVAGGMMPTNTTNVLLHCRCVSQVLKDLHAKLDVEGTLSEWPWAELEGAKTPKATDGPEPLAVGNPFPVELAVAEMPKPTYSPQVIEPPASVPNPKKTRKKKG
jgi:hypothetical protein